MNKDIKDYASLGGKKRANSLTAERRKMIASMAAKARWEKYNTNVHECTPLCRCSLCGRLKYKHVVGGEACVGFKCGSI